MKSLLFRIAVSVLLVIAAGCSAVPGDRGGDGLAAEFGETWKAYQANSDPAEKFRLAAEFLDRHPESAYTVQLVNAVTRDYFDAKMKDGAGAVEFAEPRLAVLKDEAQAAAGRRTLLRLYGKAGMGDAIARLAREVGPEASLSDRLAIVEAAAAAGDWQLLADQSAETLDLLSPENLRNRPGSEEADDARIDFELRMRRSDLYRYLGQARLRQGDSGQALEEFEAAGRNEIRNFAGLGFTELDELWGEALISSDNHPRAMEVLERAALIGGRERALKLYREAYIASGRDDAVFGRFCDERRLEIAPVTPGFTAADYSGREVAFESVKGKVTLLTFWFPT